MFLDMNAIATAVRQALKESGWFADNATNPHVPGATAGAQSNMPFTSGKVDAESGYQDPDTSLPEQYNPSLPYDKKPVWVEQAKSRTGYEDVCKAAQLQPHTDKEIISRSYGLTYADYSAEEWQALSRSERVYHVLDKTRLKAIEAERKIANANKPAPRPFIEHGQIYDEDSNPTDLSNMR